jgi:hypothetical protein
MSVVKLSAMAPLERLARDKTLPEYLASCDERKKFYSPGTRSSRSFDRSFFSYCSLWMVSCRKIIKHLFSPSLDAQKNWRLLVPNNHFKPCLIKTWRLRTEPVPVHVQIFLPTMKIVQTAHYQTDDKTLFIAIVATSNWYFFGADFKGRFGIICRTTDNFCFYL